MNQSLKQRKHWQMGLATLVLTLVLLLVSVLIAYYGAQTAIQEQRIAANYVRTRQAGMAAMAGIDLAVDYMKTGGSDHNSDGTADTLTPVALVASGTSATYKVVYCAAGAVTPVCPASSSGNLTCTAPTLLTSVQAFSCGWSDDGTAVQKVTQIIQGTPGTPGGKTPPMPLTARGNADLLVGGASILNYFNDLSVWSGGNFFGQSMTGKSFVRDMVNYPVVDNSVDYRSTGQSPSCNNPPTGYVCSTQGSTTGHDVIQGDTNLSGLTVSDLFQANFGVSQSTYRDQVAAWKVDLNSALTGENSTNIGSIANKKDTSIWVQGSAEIPSGTVVGSSGHPVILIVDGNLELGASVEINGFVFVTGKFTGGSNGKVYGAVTAGGSAEANGTFQIIYDPFNGTSAPPCGATCQLGLATRVPGSWKDW